MAFTPYFNPANADDLRLLPSAIRTANDLPEVATLAEADVLNVYTRDLASSYLPYGSGGFTSLRPAVQLYEDDGVTVTTRWVFLRGFAQDSASAPAGLKTALRRAIAEVVRWRLATWQLDQTVQSATEGATSKSMRADAREPFPLGWDRWLEPFDTLQPLWGF